MERYAELSREDLVRRLEAYERAGPSKPKALTKEGNAPFQFHASPTRHIAILVAYQGWPYHGLAIQPTIGFPTVEGELLKALEKTRLIEEGEGWEGCEFSRCGRTDRGVSGEGQVLNLWVRSNRHPDDGGYPLGDSWRPAKEEKKPKIKPVKEVKEGEGEPEPPAPVVEKKKAPPAELNYPRLLNGVLPPSIRILAWSPAPADFDSRFSCSYRHYKYAFTQDGVPGTPPLDLGLMEEGAARLIGEHDFRNFCRLDGSKQIENHGRCVIKAYFEPGPLPGQIIFNLIGTAFLWHQVRHIIAVLFLIGSRLEPPSLVTDLLDVQRFPGKPAYMMGHPLPLTLHECGYPATAGLDWRHGPYDGPWSSLSGEEKEKVRPLAEFGRDVMERQLEAERQEAEIRAWQVGGAQRRFREVLNFDTPIPEPQGALFPTGGGESIITKKYTPVVKRPMADGPDKVNAKWLEAKGKRFEERGREKKEAKERKAAADAEAYAARKVDE